MFSQYTNSSSPSPPPKCVLTYMFVFLKEHFTQSIIKPLFLGVPFVNFFSHFHSISLSLKDLLREKQSIKPREPFIIPALKQGENMLLSQQKKKKRDHLYISRLPTSIMTKEIQRKMMYVLQDHPNKTAMTCINQIKQKLSNSFIISE